MNLSKSRFLENTLLLLALIMRKTPVQRGKLRLLSIVPLDSLATKGYFEGHIFTTRNGIRWDASTLPDLIGTPLFWNGTYQDDVQMCFRLLLQEGDVVFDIGGHFGLMSIVADQLVGNSGQVIAFEPNPQSRQTLQYHLDLNKATNVTIEPVGLLDKVGTLDFYITEASANSTFVKTFANSRQYEKTVVNIDTLDGYVQRTGISPNFIKIDIEGAEYECLLGGEETIRSAKPIIMTEFNPNSQTNSILDERRALYLLKDYGYSFYLPKRSFWGNFGQGVDPFEVNGTLPTGIVPNILCVPDSATDKFEALSRKNNS